MLYLAAVGLFLAGFVVSVALHVFYVMPRIGLMNTLRERKRILLSLGEYVTDTDVPPCLMESEPGLSGVYDETRDMFGEAGLHGLLGILRAERKAGRLDVLQHVAEELAEMGSPVGATVKVRVLA